jgi:putative ABC transport system permease protein
MAIAEPLRDALSTLGRRPGRWILIGLVAAVAVATFVVAVGLTRTSASEVRWEFQQLESRLISATAAPDPRGVLPIRRADVDRVAGLPVVEAAGRMVTVARPLVSVAGGLAQEPSPTPLLFVESGAVQALGVRVIEGRVPVRSRRSMPEAMIGLGLARQLRLPPISLSPVIRIGAVLYAVSGVFAGVADRPDLLVSVVAPLPADETRRYAAEDREEVAVRVVRGASRLVADRLAVLLNPGRADRVSVDSPSAPDVLRARVEGQIGQVALWIALATLAGGAVALSQATMVSVIERRPEIGLRRAVGATSRAIAFQVILETGIVSTLGGWAGATIGGAAFELWATARGWQPDLPPALLFASFVGGAATGVLAGLLPAIRAARMDPATALRDG